MHRSLQEPEPKSIYTDKINVPGNPEGLSLSSLSIFLVLWPERLLLLGVSMVGKVWGRETYTGSRWLIYPDWL